VTISASFVIWVERLPLNERIPFPHGFRDLRYNSEKNVIGIVSGVGHGAGSCVDDGARHGPAL
jgi:hypothetical protein